MGLPGEAIFDWGGGLIWLLTQDPGLDVRAAVAGAGHATLIRALPAMHLTGSVMPSPAVICSCGAGMARSNSGAASALMNAAPLPRW